MIINIYYQATAPTVQVIFLPIPLWE